MDTPSTLGDTVIPPYKTKLPNGSHRTLVLCFDGTGDQFDLDNSNVVKFFNLLARGNHKDQMVYYQPGIGTYTSPQLVTAVGQAVSMVLDKMVAWNLDAHVISGYEFLMQNYEKDNKICLFGFSRGAYTARALAGMLYKVGLLQPGNHQQLPFAYKMYKRTDKVGWDQSAEFKKHFSINVLIDFIGVWDTVCSVGLIPPQLPFTRSNRAIRVFRHALSLDERRAEFAANHHRPVTESKLTADEKNFGNTQKLLDKDTDVKEVWFAGCHSDVGGGSVPNEHKTSLARIPLRWMIMEVFRAETGIRFDAGLLEEIGFDPASLDCHNNPSPTPKPKSDEERSDAGCRMYDQLKAKPWWWILEVLPSKQHKNEKWWKDISVHLGHGRVVPPADPTGTDSKLRNLVYVHKSVKTRQQNVATYKPKANFEELEVEYVE